MRREFTIRPAEWPNKDQEWELVFTTVLDEHSSVGNVERVSLAYLAGMYECIGEFLQSGEAHTTPVRKPKPLRKAQNV